MQRKELETQIEFLLSVALQKCGNIYDAEDLVQETLLSALAYLASGKNILKMRAWLLTVMNRKFNNALRRKYRLPLIGIGEGFDIAAEDEEIEAITQTDEAEKVRKAVAFLAKIHREVIVRHYMNGQSVATIAQALGISEGTVKSRLHAGREQVKKGIVDMEKYAKQSYEPVTLHVGNSGCWGRNKEPRSLVNGDLMAQNILWAAYSKPLSAEEISHALGIPTAYVEPVLQKLANGELMKKIGNKYYTDFMISSLADKMRYIPEQKEFVNIHFNSIWNAIGKGLEKLKLENFYTRNRFDARNALELYFAFNCLDYGLYMIFSEIFDATQFFPDRPNGGRWIAFGTVCLNNSDPDEYIDLKAHSYSGERWTRFENYAGSKHLEMHVYGTEGFPTRAYDDSPDYDFFKASDTIDDVITQLLFLIHSNTDPEPIGFNTEYLKVIPWLTKCKILRTENGKPALNIPILDRKEAVRLWDLCTEAKNAMVGELKGVFSDFFKGKKQVLPTHLDSVPLQKQYMHANNAILFATVRKAMKRGKLYDGNYDDDGHGINQEPCPMVLIIE